jgi:hypothetical protein
MVREFVSARVETARQQATVHQRRLEALKAEQKNLVQLHHKGLVDDEVLAEEQERLKRERTHALQLIEHANYEVADVMEALEEALILVDETFPYGEANDPVLWELINQATHLEIRPFIYENGWGKNGRQLIRVRARRDPVYEAADAELGITRPDTPQGPSTPGQPALAAPQVRNRSAAPR